VPRDPRDVGRPVIEVSKLSRELGTVDPFRTIGQLSIDALDNSIVRCDPRREIGRFSATPG
jgi:hypothetical protein